MSSQIYKKYNWPHASAELAICTARVEVLGTAKSTTACITSLHVVGEIILADFNLAVSTQTTKLNSPSNSQLYSISDYTSESFLMAASKCCFILVSKST